MKKQYLLDDIRRYISLNKTTIIVISIIFLLGVMTGVFSCLKSNINIDISFIQNYFLRLLLLRKTSIIVFVLTEILVIGLLLLIFYFLSFFKLSQLLSIALCLYFSYIVGIDICVIFITLSGLAKILISLIYLIFSFASIFLLLYFYFRLSQYNRELKFCFNSHIIQNGLKMLLTFFILSLVLFILEGLLLCLIFKIFVFY